MNKSYTTRSFPTPVHLRANKAKHALRHTKTYLREVRETTAHLDKARKIGRLLDQAETLLDDIKAELA